MENPDRIVSIRVPPFVKGGQGGFFHASLGLMSLNPPQPPFNKGGRGLSPSVSDGAQVQS
jgi:hypothetical protein